MVRWWNGRSCSPSSAWSWSCKPDPGYRHTACAACGQGMGSGLPGRGTGRRWVPARGDSSRGVDRPGPLHDTRSFGFDRMAQPSALDRPGHSPGSIPVSFTAFCRHGPGSGKNNDSVVNGPKWSFPDGAEPACVARMPHPGREFPYLSLPAGGFGRGDFRICRNRQNLVGAIVKLYGIVWVQIVLTNPGTPCGMVNPDFYRCIQ